MLHQDLQKIGLNEKEARVYLGLLELGEGNIEAIADKSGVKRTTVYDVIASLSAKGLIGKSKSKRRIRFFAENPAELERRLDEQKRIANKLLPELLSFANRLERKPKIRYFEGIEGIKAVYRDTLRYPGEEILAWASQEAVGHFDVDYLWQEYVPARLEKKIWERVIAPDNDEMRKLKAYDEKHLRQIRLVSAENPPFEVEIDLYGKRNIGIMSFAEKIGLIVESQKLYSTLKSIFELNWMALE